MNNEQEIRNILIKELGLADLPEEAQNEIVTKIGGIILQSVTLGILEKLPQDAREEFEVLSKEGDNERIQEFLELNVPHLYDIMQEETARVVESFRAAQSLDTKSE